MLKFLFGNESMLKILIADDHPIFRQGLKQVLARESDLHVAGEAGNGREALEEVTKQHYDVILLDITMPGESGLSIIRQLKQIDKDLSVLVLSMHPEEQYAVQALKAGAAAYLTKVSVPDELVNAIRKVANGGKYISSTLAEKLAYAIEEPQSGCPGEWNDRRRVFVDFISDEEPGGQVRPHRG